MIPLSTILFSEHYQLRVPNESDIDFVFSTAQYPGFHDGMLWNPPKNKTELLQPLKNSIESWKAGKGYSFTIETKENHPTRLGRTSIRKTEHSNVWNVGFWIHPVHQKKGIMTEVLKAITNFGFDKLNADKITAQYAIWNKASEKVLVNNNFKFVRYIEKGYFKNEKWESENEYELRKE